MNKLLSTFAIATTLALTSTAALADHDRRVVDHRTDRRPTPAPIVIAPQPAPIVSHDVLASKLALGRRGTLTMVVRGMTMNRDLFLISSDDRLDLRSVTITYSGGRTVTLRGSQARALDLPDHGRIRLIEVRYVNRGANHAMVKLIARGDRGGFNGRNGGDDRRGRGGFGGNG